MKRVETLRITERDALLSRLTADLIIDPRVVSAWLHGSLGRGDGDAWSDLDLWVVLDDHAYTHEIRHAFVEDALFTEEAPQNGPPGGSYLMSAHDAPTGPHLVDWYFQPLRFARPDTGRIMLVDRRPIPFAAEMASTPHEWRPSPAEDAANKAALFWAMILVQAKYIARKPVEVGMGFEGFLLSLLRDIAVWRGGSIEEVETPGLILAAPKLDRLRDLGERMERVDPGLSGPRSAVNRFLANVRVALEEVDHPELDPSIRYAGLVSRVKS